MDFCGKRNSTKLEKLQERAFRFVYRDTTSTYEEILKRGHFLPLSIYRLKFLAIEVYKYINNLNPTYLRDLFVHKNIVYELRDPHKLEQPKSNTKNMAIDLSCIMGRNCGICSPSDVKRSTSIYEFRGKVTEWCFTVSPNDFDIFKCIILDCLWNVLEVSYKIGYQFPMTLYSLYNLKCIFAIQS